MAVLPSICGNEQCRTIYFTEVGSVKASLPNKPGIIDVPEGAAIAIGYGKCPNCEAQGYVPAGRYEFYFKDNNTETPARFISGPPSTKAIIEQAQVLIKALKQSKAQKQAEVIAALETVSPTIASISRATVDKFNYKEWTNLIIALLSLLIAIQQAYFKKEDKPVDSSGVKPEYLEMLIKENNEIRAQQQAKAVAVRIHKPAKQQPAKAAAHPGRNQPCPCSSGKKFKHCHGA